MALQLTVCLLALTTLVAVVNSESEAEYYAKYEKAIRRSHLSTTQNFSTWDVKPIGSSFLCDVALPKRNPTSVHELTPSDINVVAALGDSITAAFGAKATNLINLLTEYRGVSWSVGGDGDLSEVTTIPNIIKEFNPNVVGFSVGKGNEKSSNAGLNRAVSGAIAQDMRGQAEDLVNKMKASTEVDFDNDWKLVTIWIGGNNLCAYCNNKDKHSPENYVLHIEEALDYLKANLPKTFVNLVQIIDITKLAEVSTLTCDLLHLLVCPCKRDNPTSDAAKVYQEKLSELVNSEKYDDSEDFTVVLQPFMKEVEVPRNDDGSVDTTYFSLDCFHFSTKGHREGTVALWNNMVEPVGSKTLGWTPGAEIKCPDPPNFYLYTKQNSPSANTVGDQYVSDEGMKDPSHQPGSNTAAIIAGSVVTVAVVAVVLMGLSMLAGFIVRRRSQQLNVTGETTPLVE